MAQKYDPKTKKWYYYGSYVKNGKRIQYKKRGFTTERKARIAEEDFREFIESQKDKILFQELSEKYITFQKSRVKDSTLLKDTFVVNKWNKDFGNKYVQDITKAELQEYIDNLDLNYSKRYVEKLFYVANSIFKFGIKKELIDFNPLDRIERNRRPNEFKKEMQFWEINEFELFIEYVNDPMWKAFFATLFYMGIRKGEAMALMWKDIDFENKIMNIDKTTGARDRVKKVKYTPPKTKNSYRKITIPNVLMEYLKKWYEIEKEFSGFGENSFVFGNDLPLASETIRRAFDNYIIEVNKDKHLKRIRVHDLRHSHASYLINNMEKGFSDYDIARRLGDTVETLHNTYAHWYKRKDAKIINFMNSDLG